MATALAYLQRGAMETTFYHDEFGRSDNKQGEIMKKLKTGMNTSRPMTLDFTGAKKKDQKAFTPLLSSPDLNMLKLASPDLERLIIQQNGHVTTTPTPSGILHKCPTEEQEAYARGFVDALNELHQQQGHSGPPPSPMTLIRGSLISAQAIATTASSQANNENSLPATFLPTSSAALPLTTTTSLPGGVIQFTSQQNAEPMRTESPLYTMSMQGTSQPSVIKEELPQTVPCLGPPMSPIDMESQERIKLERKRARNRVAARKCRTRKLERISRLEDRVDDLKGQNNDLQSTANSLRDQVCQLKKQIMQHVSNGCQIMTTSQSNLL